MTLKTWLQNRNQCSHHATTEAHEQTGHAHSGILGKPSKKTRDRHSDCWLVWRKSAKSKPRSLIGQSPSDAYWQMSTMHARHLCSVAHYSKRFVDIGSLGHAITSTCWSRFLGAQNAIFCKTQIQITFHVGWMKSTSLINRPRSRIVTDLKKLI